MARDPPSEKAEAQSGQQRDPDGYVRGYRLDHLPSGSCAHIELFAKDRDHIKGDLREVRVKVKVPKAGEELFRAYEREHSTPMMNVAVFFNTGVRDAF